MALKYVSKTGSNGAAGDIATPWLTLAYATTQLSAGDTLYIRGGANYAAREVWTETVTITTGTHNNGTSPSPIYVRNYPGEYCEFQNTTGLPWYIYQRNYWRFASTKADGSNGTDGTNSYFDINSNDKTSSGYCMRFREADGCYIYYLEARNGQYFCLIEFRDCDDWLAYGCKIHDNFIGPGEDAAGILSQSNTVSNTGAIIEYCTIYDCGGDCYVADLPNGGDSADLHVGVIVRYNTFAAWSTAGKSENAVDLKVSADAQIYGNTISGFRWNDGTVSGSGANGADSIVVHSYSTDVFVFWNEFSDISGSAVRIQSPASTIYNNIARDFVYEVSVTSYLRSVWLWLSSSGTHYFFHNTTVGRHGASDGNILGIATGLTVVMRNNAFKDTGDDYQEASVTITATHNGWYNVAFRATSTATDVTAAPLFYNEGANDFRPSAGSPLINKATAVTGISQYKLGVSADIGYYEYDSASSISFRDLSATATALTAFSNFRIQAVRFDGTTAVYYTGVVTVGKNSGAGSLSGNGVRTAVSGTAQYTGITPSITGTYILYASSV